jgi:hypothetical protein
MKKRAREGHSLPDTALLWLLDAAAAMLETKEARA